MTYSMDEVVLGCLLHDVGKLLQRAHDRLSELTDSPLDLESTLCPSSKGFYSHKHVLYTNLFFDLVRKQGIGLPQGINLQRVEEIASYHHKPDSCPIPGAAWLCALGDRYSAGMDRREDEETSERAVSAAAYRTTPLQCIFDQVILDLNALGKPERHAYRMEMLDPEDADRLIPVQWPQRGSDPELPKRYAGLWQGFWNEFSHLGSAENRLSPRIFEESLLGLLERYTWSIPSSTLDAPDISLFDHARVTTAIAAALYRFHEVQGQLGDVSAIRNEKVPKFRFLAGDLSGIQGTLFTLQTQGVKGVNKILRARSFMMSAITEAAALRVIEAFDLPHSSIVQQAGGRFIVLVPALADVEKRLRRLREQCDSWLLGRYTGTLALNLVLSDPFSGASFGAGEFHKVMDQLGAAIEAGKQQPLPTCSQGVIQRGFPHDVCMACGVRPGEKAAETGYRCRSCEDEAFLGKRLVRAELLVWGRGLPRKWDPVELLGLELALLEESTIEWGTGVVSVRRTRAAESPIPWAVRCLANHIPLFGDRYELQDPRYEGIHDEDFEPGAGVPKTFMHIAADALEPVADGSFRGKPFLALLKADVDYLGFIFGHGLRRGGTANDRMTLSRLAQLSRMMDLYFTGYLKGLLHREFRDTYTVYAGGDDLMLIGPWRQTVALAQRVNETFRAYTGHNPNITLSAGLTLMKANYPVNRAVREAESFLERSKGAGRNRVCALTERPLTWDRFSKRLKDAEWLHEQLQGDFPVSTGFVYRILQIAEDAEAVAVRGDVGKAGWRARLAYHLARNVKARDKNQQRQRITEWMEHLGLDDQFRLLGDHPNIHDWRLPLTIALYRNRT